MISTTNRCDYCLNNEFNATVSKSPMIGVQLVLNAMDRILSAAHSWREFGREAEFVVASYLRSKGWSIMFNRCSCNRINSFRRV